ncbi:hypothetical protein HYU14_01715 [Candidatus Woesearchaeota archaeon]|nr:hypothetical protein [Candidatus Woesearchaeota archaeon]
MPISFDAAKNLKPGDIVVYRERNLEGLPEKSDNPFIPTRESIARFMKRNRIIDGKGYAVIQVLSEGPCSITDYIEVPSHDAPTDENAVRAGDGRTLIERTVHKGETLDIKIGVGGRTAICPHYAFDVIPK